MKSIDKAAQQAAPPLIKGGFIMNKRKFLSFFSALTLGLTSLPFTNIYTAAEDKTAVSSASDNKLDAEKFYVVVGTYENNYTQLKYVYPNSNAGYSADKIVWENAPADLSYGDVLVSDGNEKKTLVYSAPDNPVYAMASYYKLDDTAVLNKVGNCSDLMDSKELTVTSAMYDGSGHWSIHLNDADGKEYYYGYSSYGSTLGVALSGCKTGDKYQFAFNDGKLVVPMAKKNDTETVTTVTTSSAPQTTTTAPTENTQNKSYWIFYNDIDTKDIDETVAEKVHDYTYSLYEQGIGGSEAEMKIADYSQEIRLGLLKEAYKEASSKILKELDVKGTGVFCSSFTPAIICSLTDEQLEIAKKSENIKQIDLLADMELKPLVEFSDKNSFIDFFTKDVEGNPVLDSDVKVDAIFNSGSDNKTDYLIVYGLPDVKAIDETVKKLKENSRLIWGSPIETYSGSIFRIARSSLPTNNLVQLIVFADDVLPGFTGYDPARYSEEVGFDVKPYISFLGDTNGDFKLDSTDASAILSAYAKVQTNDGYVLSKDDIKKMDVDGNGSVDAVDASCILSYYTYTSTGGSGTFRDFLKNRNA